MVGQPSVDRCLEPTSVVWAERRHARERLWPGPIMITSTSAVESFMLARRTESGHGRGGKLPDSDAPPVKRRH